MNTVTKTVVKAVTKEDIMNALKELAAKLERTPSIGEFQRVTQISKYHVRGSFGTYSELLKAANLEREGQGHLAEMLSLFQDWGGIVRTLKKVPTIAEYDMHSKFSVRPLTRRFERWARIPAGMRDYAIEQGLEVEWEDVLKVIAEHLEQPKGKIRIYGNTTGSTFKHRILTDQPVYGQPLMPQPFNYAPTNELGVVFAFGSVAREMGFSIMRIQAEFPDCEAMREVEPGRWQRVRIEFEFESRNFVSHLHPVAGCDLIVCWRHNWTDCPLEVLELERVIMPKQ